MVITKINIPIILSLFAINRTSRRMMVRLIKTKNKDKEFKNKHVYCSK